MAIVNLQFPKEMMRLNNKDSSSMGRVAFPLLGANTLENLHLWDGLDEISSIFFRDIGQNGQDLRMRIQFFTSLGSRFKSSFVRGPNLLSVD